MSRKLTLRDCHNVAQFKGGKCLALEYIDIFTPIEWMCSAGHTWFAALNGIKNKGTWCARCANTIKYTLEECKEFAKVKGGECLSNVYISVKTKMEWKCHQEHKWFARFDDIKHDNNWCPYCAKRAKHTIDYCQKLAETRGGVCLSPKYVNLSSHMEWKCSAGHVWYASFGNIKAGTWCPLCSEGKTQQSLTNIIRTFFPNFTILSDFRGFKWLKIRGSSSRQEFDIWIPELKLAIEYDGQQHFRPVCFGGISPDKAKSILKRTKWLDKRKNKQVKSHPEDVALFIRFNYKEKLTKEYVAEKLISSGIQL